MSHRCHISKRPRGSKRGLMGPETLSEKRRWISASYADPGLGCDQLGTDFTTLVPYHLSSLRSFDVRRCASDFQSYRSK